MTPIEARCDHCKQPLLCARCWENERLREENAPLAPGEAEASALFYRLSANNSRLIERAEADREGCEGIARPTQGRPRKDTAMTTPQQATLIGTVETAVTA